MRTLITLNFLLFFLSINLSAQEEDYQLGINPNYTRQNQGAYYDYSEEDGLNIKVSVWGFVKFPGRYVIPERSDIKDLISYAGGVTDDTNLDDLRIYRMNPDSSQTLLKFNYEDLWWGDNLERELKIEKIQPGDILVVPGRPRLYFENYLSIGLSVLGVLLSLTTLIITTNK